MGDALAYLVELDVETTGSLDAPTDRFPADSAFHDLRTPYPALPPDLTVPFTGSPGESSAVPDVFWYHELWDWVCGLRLYELLKAVAPADIHTIGRGVLGAEELRIVQVVGMLDVVDMSQSITRKYPGYEILDFPSFRASRLQETKGRIFRVPQSGTMTFMGGDVVEAVVSAGITGFRFLPIGR